MAMSTMSSTVLNPEHPRLNRPLRIPAQLHPMHADGAGSAWHCNRSTLGDHPGTTRHAVRRTSCTSPHSPLPRYDRTDQRKRLTRSPGGQVASPPSLTPAADTNGTGHCTPVSDWARQSAQMRDHLGQLLRHLLSSGSAPACLASSCPPVTRVTERSSGAFQRRRHRADDGRRRVSVIVQDQRSDLLE